MKKKRKQKKMRIIKNILNILVVVFLLKSCSSQSNNDFKIEVVSKETYEDGMLRNIYWKSTGDAYEGKSYFFLDNGEIYAEFNFKDGLKNGKARTYDKGLILSEENYFNDKLNGEAKYYDKGRLETEGYFRDDLKTGIWSYFYKNKLVLSELYSKGKLQQTIYKDVKHFDKNNRIPPELDDAQNQ